MDWFVDDETDSCKIFGSEEILNSSLEYEIDRLM